MDWLDALILGIIQGLCEFLPVSSSGHLEIGKVLLLKEIDEDISFTLMVHAATVLSTMVVLKNDIIILIKGAFKFQYNEDLKYVIKVIISMMPVVIIGLLYKEELESLFSGNLVLVGSMLLITAVLLSYTYYVKSKDGEISYINAIIIGLAQAVAVLPGISRSGATIATALLLGIKKETAAKFSFLMVLLPILGASFKELLDGGLAESNIAPEVMFIGFISAFFSGIFACRVMLKIVKEGKLIYFGIYCAIAGSIALFVGLNG
jgi:undecaprenyl-diphosphatase